MIFLSELVEHPLNPRFGASTRSAIPARRRAPGDPGRTLFPSSGGTFPANWQDALLNPGCYSLISASGPAGLPPGLPSTPAPRPSVHAEASLTVFDANFPSSLLKTFLFIAHTASRVLRFLLFKDRIPAPLQRLWGALQLPLESNKI